MTTQSTYAIYCRTFFGTQYLENVFTTTLDKAQEFARKRAENLSKWDKRNLSNVNPIILRKANSPEQIAHWVEEYKQAYGLNPNVKKNSIGGYIA